MQSRSPFGDVTQPPLTPEARLNRAMRMEGVARQRSSAIFVSASMLVIAPLLVLLTGLPAAYYYHAILLVFVGLIWFQYYVAKVIDGDWPDYLLVPFYFGILSFTLIYPIPLAHYTHYEFAASLGLRAGTFVYFFFILTSFAFSVSPWLLVWCGVCGAVAWAVGTAWVVAQPGIEITGVPQTDATGATSSQWLETIQQPRFVDLAVTFQDVIVFMIVAVLLALVVAGSRQLLLRRTAEERRGANLARYVPAQLAARMAETDMPFTEDRETEAVVLFTDIVGFSRWAETRSPAQVLQLLREVHAIVGSEVFAAEGVLDKYIGDGAMATFGITVTDAPAERALSCMEAINARMAAFNLDRSARGESPILLSMGAHIGRVTVGDVGGEGRMELAVLGDAVNVASRLETLTRKIGAAAAVSEALVMAAGGAREGWFERGEEAISGRVLGVTVWMIPRQNEVIGLVEAAH